MHSIAHGAETSVDDNKQPAMYTLHYSHQLLKPNIMQNSIVTSEFYFTLFFSFFRLNNIYRCQRTLKLESPQTKCIEFMN